MNGAVDCEMIGLGWLAQPVNALSALAFVTGGALVLFRRTELRWLGGAMVATGLGSFLYHGTTLPGSRWAHDVTLAWLLLVVAGIGWRSEKATRLPGLGVLAVSFAVAPVIAEPVTVVLAVAAVVSAVVADRSAATWAPLSLLAAAAVLGRLGATGGPLCEPGSLVQFHAVWHVGAAAAVTWWALIRRRPAGSS